MIIDVETIVKKPMKGKVAIFQTDTVYGIGCLYQDESAIERIYAIKKRDVKKPLAILCGSLEQAQALAENYTDFETLATQYWPGALTLVVKRSDKVPMSVTRGMDTVGLRIPNDPVAQKILNHFGPMAVTSLNISSEPDVTTYEEALRFKSVVDYLVKGSSTAGLSSTVYDTLNGKVLRQGVVKID